MAQNVTYIRDGVNASHYSFNPLIIVTSPWRHRELLYQLVKRDIVGRYRGSFMGLFWSFVHPLLMLAVYTTVFGIFLKVRWAETQNSIDFSIILFAGLIVFNFFSECLSRAPTMVVSNPNYVKKIVFPLEILPWVAIGSALFHASVSLLVWSIYYLVIHGGLNWTMLLLPLLIIPFVLLILGLSWLLSAAGVYARDVSQVIGLTLQVLMYLSPIFYAVESVPEAFRSLLLLNPLTFIIEQARATMIGGVALDFSGLLIYSLVGVLVAIAGLFCFQKLREGFADVI